MSLALDPEETLGVCETGKGEPAAVIVIVTVSGSSADVDVVVRRGSSELVMLCDDESAGLDGLIDRGGGDEGVTVMVPVNGVGSPESGERVYVRAYGRYGFDGSVVQPTVTGVAGTPEGVITVDHSPDTGTSGIVTVTNTVEVCLKPSGNVKVRTEVISLPKGSKAVTDVAGPAVAEAVTVTVLKVASTGESSEANAGTSEPAVVELAAGRVTVTVVKRSEISVTVTRVTAVV